MSRTDQGADHGWKLAAFRELRSSSNSALAALEALFNLETYLKAPANQKIQGRWPPLSFLVLKKHCLQLSVQTHKCIRLLPTITDEDNLALRTALTKQMLGLGRLLEDLPTGDSDGQFLPGTAIENKETITYFQKDTRQIHSLDQAKCPNQGFTISRAVTRHFFRASGLFPRINHALQQLDCSNLQTLSATSAKIQQLILECPLPMELENEFTLAWQCLNPANDPDIQLSLYPRVHSEDGNRSSFAGLYPANIHLESCHVQSLTLGYKQILASLYSPQSLIYVQIKGLRHERTEISALCLVGNGIPSAASAGIEPGDSEMSPPSLPKEPRVAGNPNRLHHRIKAFVPPLLRGQSGTPGAAAGTIRIIHNPDDIGDLPENTIAVVPEARIDWILLLPRIAALLIEAECSSAPLLILARECSLPVIYALGNTASVLQDGMQVTVDADHGAVFRGIDTASLQFAPPLPRSTAGAPVEQALRQLCLLSGASRIFHPNWPIFKESGILTCKTMLDIIRWCRFRSTQALLNQYCGETVQLPAASLSFCVHRTNPTLASDAVNTATTMETLAPPPLHKLWQGMAKQMQHCPHNQHRAEKPLLKNSVLLGDKYCTVEMLCANFSLYIDVDMDEPAQTFRLLFLVQDTRLNAIERLQQLVDFLTTHSIAAQANDTQLTAVSTVTKRQTFMQHLSNLGAACIQALL